MHCRLPWRHCLTMREHRIKVFRGGMQDVFGYTTERRWERALIGEYEQLVDEIVSRLHAHNHAEPVELALAASGVRGYGHVKLQSPERVSPQQQDLLQAFRDRKITEPALARQA
ncbi:MAG: DUF6537 domain-containing protein [Burkholderiales bacterium]